eukprot:scaffold19363_cov103-Isochrysis_galbana.AAC.5
MHEPRRAPRRFAVRRPDVSPECRAAVRARRPAGPFYPSQEVSLSARCWWLPAPEPHAGFPPPRARSVLALLVVGQPLPPPDLALEQLVPPEQLGVLRALPRLPQTGRALSHSFRRRRPRRTHSGGAASARRADATAPDGVARAPTSALCSAPGAERGLACRGLRATRPIGRLPPGMSRAGPAARTDDCGGRACSSRQRRAGTRSSFLCLQRPLEGRLERPGRKVAGFVRVGVGEGAVVAVVRVFIHRLRSHHLPGQLIAQPLRRGLLSVPLPCNHERVAPYFPRRLGCEHETPHTQGPPARAERPAQHARRERGLHQAVQMADARCVQLSARRRLRRLWPSHSPRAARARRCATPDDLLVIERPPRCRHTVRGYPPADETPSDRARATQEDPAQGEDPSGLQAAFADDRAGPCAAPCAVRTPRRLLSARGLGGRALGPPRLPRLLNPPLLPRRVEPAVLPQIGKLRSRGVQLLMQSGTLSRRLQLRGPEAILLLGRRGRHSPEHKAAARRGWPARGVLLVRRAEGAGVR